MHVRFYPGAQHELAEAAVWYEQRREGVDSELQHRPDLASQTSGAAAGRSMFWLLPLSQSVSTTVGEQLTFGSDVLMQLGVDLFELRDHVPRVLKLLAQECLGLLQLLVRARPGA